MELFLDTADLAIIQQSMQTGIVDGVTTNPSHLAKVGGDPMAQIAHIIKLLPHGKISVEVTETESEMVLLQARKIAKISPKILVKIPCHKDYYSVIKQLISEGVQINVTLVFTLIQATLMAKLGVAYISPFVGRLDDIDSCGTDLLHDIRAVFDRYRYQTKILAASIRHTQHMHEAIMAGVDAITVPAALFEKMADHPLTDQGIDLFMRDWKKLNNVHFF